MHIWLIVNICSGQIDCVVLSKCFLGDLFKDRLISSNRALFRSRSGSSGSRCFPPNLLGRIRQALYLVSSVVRCVTTAFHGHEQGVRLKTWADRL